MPLWVARLYPGEAWWRHESMGPDGGDTKIKRAKRPSVKSRKFCATCNNVWMSQLEQAVQPILTEMIEGRRIRLDAARQELVAFWVCKTTLAFESMEPTSRRFAPDAVYPALYEARAPLDRCQVWLARRRAGPSVAWHRAHTLAREDTAEDGFGATLAMGQMVAHVLWHPEGAGHLLLARRLANTLIQIWPIRRQTRVWPPVMHLEEGMELTWLARDVVQGAEVGAV